ncbi:RHS repeat-associated core domain-containing protein [Microbulbifer halophilus]|uniref:RHS repeat-associated core domain-containing protein n=1 Tax=Microbulbifer halophilus TaxID=453963 RepID=A0ABW5EDA1_9GAMM|nr:RHS repeat-associated core domain-containing protein [Microbulbifer halophilus]
MFHGSHSVKVALKPDSIGALSNKNVTSGTTDTNGKFKVRWGAADDSPRVDGYEVQQRFRPEGGSWGSWYPSGGGHPSHAFQTGNTYVYAQGLHAASSLPDGDYRHRVRSYVTVGGYSNHSSWKYAPVVTVRNKPGHVTGLEPTVSAPSETFSMTWNAVSGASQYEELRYQLQCKEPDDSNFGFDTCGNSNLNGTRSEIDLPQGSNGTYSFRVRACNGLVPAGCRRWPSSSTDVPVDIPVPVPDTPDWVTEPLDRNYGQVAMDWELPDGSPDAAGFVLQQRCKTGEDGCGQIGWHEITPDEENPQDGSYSAQVELDDQYRYRVKACNSVGECSNWRVSSWVKVHALKGIGEVLETITTTVPGDTPYSVDVTNTGDASITIPVDAAPGVNGLAPNVSLGYSGLRYHHRTKDQLPEDILGYGWRLGGFSEIRRCITSLDQSRIEIALDDSDLLCLDGEPLVAVSGDYWQTDTQYRTLRDSSRLITQKATSEGKPWFQVEAPDGRVQEYGREPESRLKVGQSPYFGWSLNKVTDAFGNTVEYRYHRDLAEGINYPLDIIYGDDGDARIQFEYSPRSDIPAEPLSEEIDQGQLVRLHRILVRLNNKDLREYRLISQDEGQIEGYRRLKEVQVCGFTKQHNRECLEPVKFDWQEREIGDYEFGIDFELGVERVTDSLGAVTEISYRTLSPDDSAGFIQQSPFGSEDGINVPGAYPLPPSYPDLNDPGRGVYRLVVSEVRRSNGFALDWHRTQYRYQGPGLMGSDNWGFLGFHAQKVRDDKSDISTYSQFRQDLPHAGATARLIQCHGDCVSGEVLTEKRYRYGALDLGSGVMRTYIDQALEAQLEGGQLLGYRERRTALDTEAPDGNIGQVILRRTATERIAESANVDDGGSTYWGEVKEAQINGADVLRSSQTVTEYANRTSPWLLGFAEYEQKQHFRGDIGSQLDRQQSAVAAPWPGSNKPGSVIQYPDDEQYELQTHYSYDGSGNLESETVSGVDIATRTTEVLEFLDNRYPTRISNPLQQEITVGYDQRFGSVDSVTDANSRTTSIIYDAFGREDDRTNADGVIFDSSYESCYNCDSVKNISPRYKLITDSAITPRVTRYYDELDRLLREEWEGFDGTTVRRDYGYDDRGRLEYQTDSYPSTESNPSFTKVNSFDSRDRVTSLTKPDGAAITTDYSVVNGRVKVRVEEEVLNATGNPVEAQIKESFYLVTGDLDETVDAKGTAKEVSTSYTYDGSGHMKTVTVDGDTTDFSSTFNYDLAGFRTNLTDPNLGTVESRFNALGQLIKQIDNEGQHIDYRYDKLGRPRFQADADGVAEWTYDPINGKGQLGSRRYVDGGLLQGGAISGGTEVFRESRGYNGNAKLETLTTDLSAGGLSRNYQHSYDYYGIGDGRLRSVTYPNGAQAEYDYGDDGRGYLHEVRDHTGTAIKTFKEITARGQVKQEVYGNGLITTRGYDPESGRLTKIITGGGSIQNNEYAWRSNGTLESRLIKDANGVEQRREEFIYDALNRLTDSNISIAGGAARSLSTTYNKLGNIRSKTSSHQSDTQVTGYQYGQTRNAGPNAVSNVDIDGVAHTLHYNKNGAITRYDAASGDDKWITWNARQLPTEIVLGDSKTTGTPTARDRFSYGPGGDRYYRETSWWDEDAQTLRTEKAFILGKFEEQLPANDPDYQRIEKTRLDANVLHIAAYRHTGEEEEFKEYLHRDHLGSIEKVTDGTGDLIILDTAFEPFGGRRSPDWHSQLSDQAIDYLLEAQGISTRRGFTGHEHLDRTGLIHMNGRIYDPTLGRFLSPDPVVQFPESSQSWNRYSYVRNNPLSVTDPSGYMEEVVVTYECRCGGPPAPAFPGFFPGPTPGPAPGPGRSPENDANFDNSNDSDESEDDSDDKNTEKAKEQADEEKCEYGGGCVTVTATQGATSSLIGDSSGFITRDSFGNPVDSGLGALFFLAEWLSGAKATSLLKGEKIAIGISKKGLKHLKKHLKDFQKLDSNFTLKDQIKIGKKIAGNPANLINVRNGSRGFEAVVNVGGNSVQVRAVLNAAGNLRSVYPVL